MTRHRFKLATYNIRKAIGRDGRRRPDRTLDVIEALRADIVVLQEADFRFKGRRAIFSEEELRERTGLHVVDVAPDAPGLGWHGNMLLVRDAVRCLHVQPITLPGLEPRGAVHATFQIGSQRLALVHCHLGLVPSQRRQQAQILADRPDPAVPTVLAGDLNAAGVEPRSLSPLYARFDEVDTGPSFPTRWPLIRFDRIFHSQPLIAVDAAVHDTAEARKASDHLPVTATFAFT